MWRLSWIWIQYISNMMGHMWISAVSKENWSLAFEYYVLHSQDDGRGSKICSVSQSV